MTTPSFHSATVRPATRRRLIAVGTALALVCGLLVAAPLGTPFDAAPAQADTAPGSAATPKTAAADALPTAQINGVAWTQLIVGTTVFVGGEFTSARPAGAAPGTGEVVRNNLLAYDLTTGVLKASFNPNVNGSVRALVASPDGSRLYVGGAFTSVGGVARSRLAALDTATGALVTSWVPQVNARVNALGITASTVYAGGTFTSANGVAREKIAAFATSNAAIRPWSGSPTGGSVNALTVSPDGAKVIIGGSFTAYNGSSDPGYGMAATDAATGASLPWKVNSLVRNGGVNAAILSLTSSADGVFGTGYVFKGAGNFEGTFRASWADGTLIWLEDCHGDTYSAVPAQGVVYTTGHAHYCGNIGGFPQADPWTYHRTLTFGMPATGTITADPLGYYNFAGTPRPSLLTFYPDINTGTYTGQSQGPWNVTANSNYVVYGGEFTIVNNKKQQGLTRFATSAIAPNKEGPRLSGADFVPSVASFEAGSARLSWPANYDRDNEHLSYEVLRDGVSVKTLLVSSTDWNRPAIAWTDTGLTPGATYSYRLRVKDPFGNVRTGNSIPVTVAGAGSHSVYTETILDDARSYWPLGETTGSTAFDWASGIDATVGAGVRRQTAGAVIGDSGTASTFDGSSTGFAATNTAEPATDTFSVEAWVKTTSTKGGKIIGFGTNNSGTSSSYDRHVYMDDAGLIWFGVHPGSVRTVNTSVAYNDGAWHHVVATLGPAGMTLYVDGARAAARADVSAGQAYTGYWRIGGDNLGGWPNRPTNNFIAADIDEVAMYTRPLTGTEVADHYQASGRGDVSPPPVGTAYATDAFERTVVGGLGTAPVGGAWSVSGSTGNYSVSAGAARLKAVAAGATATAMLPGVSSTDTEVRVSAALQQAASGSGAYLTVLGRKVGADDYRTRLKVASTGDVQLQVLRGGTSLATVSPPGLIYATGDRLNLVMQATGVAPTTVRAKVWKVGATEPTGWQVTATDGTAALQQAGSIGLSLYLGGTATTVPVTAAFDDLWAGPTPAAPPPPANVAPAAAFTVSASGLTANLDAAGSVDPDGTIAGYAWTFGDGGTATGATASHLYGAAGTYPITLIVTDDDGATATTTHSVTVSAPPAGGGLARDAFERTVAAGLGSAEVGGAWTTTGSAANYTVTQGAASLRSSTAGAMETAQLAAVSSTSTDVRVGVAVQQPATGSGTYLSLLGRIVGADDYRARVRLNADGTVTLQTMRGGTALRTLLVPGLTPAVGDKLTIRLQVTGTAPTTVRAKVWASALAEPSAWQLEGTDATSAMQVPGGVGIALYLGSTATNAPATARFDDLVAGVLP